MKRRRLGNKLHRVPFGFKIVGAGIRSGLFLFKLRELFHPVNAFLVGGMDVFHGHLHAGMSRPFLNDRARLCARLRAIFLNYAPPHPPPTGIH